MLELKNIYKTYSSKNGVTHRALENVSLKFANKGLVFILGKSGSGKSTLLNLIGGIDNYDRGEITFLNKSFNSFKEEDYNYYRNSCVGFVFQDFNLLDNLTVYENVAIALNLQGKENEEKILDLLDKMSVLPLKNRKVNELSGGQKQRVAIARALIKEPKIILADEPTGALDSETSDEIIKILQRLSEDRLVIIVTHNKELAYDYGDRIIEIRDGFVLKDLLRKSLDKDENSNSSMVSSNLVIVPKGKKIDKQSIDDLNATIKEKRQDYYLLVEDNKYRAMSIYPNVSEVINDENNNQSFKPYHYKNDDDITINKEKYNYPTKNCVKFAFKNMKKKKGKLFFSIILSILSVILTGAAVNFTNYSLATAVGKSIEKDNGNQIEVSSSFAINDESYDLQANDLAYLNSLDKEIAYLYDEPLRYQYNVSATKNEVDDNMAKDKLFLDKTFNGFLVCDNIEDFGYDSKNFKIIYQMENIGENDYLQGVYLSSTVASTIVRYNIYDTNHIHEYTSIDKLVGESISVSGSFYKVLGIYDIDNKLSLYEHFKPLHEIDDYYLKNEYEQVYKSTLGRLVVTNSFMDNFKATKRSLRIKSTTRTIDNLANKTVSADFIKPLKSIDFSRNNTEVDFYNSEWNKNNFKDKIKNMKQNQIFISTSFFKSLTNENYQNSKRDEMQELINIFNSMHHRMNMQNNRVSNGGEVYQALENIEIIGVVIKNPGDSGTMRRVYVGNECYDQLVSNYYKANKALIKMNGHENYAKFVQKLYDNGFTINNEFVSYFLSFASTIEKFSTFINIGVILWFILVGTLLYSFMSSSIKDSSKQIGILKALGANNKDIFKIFATEAIYIAIFALVFGVLGYYLIGLLINYIVTSLFYTFYFTIFTFDFVTLIIMVLSLVVILAISLIIPMSKLNNIKPIDVMNSNN